MIVESMIQARLLLKDATLKATTRRFLDYTRRKPAMSEEEK